MHAIWASLICLTTVGIATGSDVPIGTGVLDIEYTVGEGANTSYVVVDFSGAPDTASGPGNSYAFGYRWDGAATSAEALFALADAGPEGLAIEVTDFGGGLGFAVDRISFGEDDDTPVFGVDDRFWNFYKGTYDGTDVTWVFSDMGISTRALANGSFDGFRAQPLGFSDPSEPVVAIPEPSGLLGCLIITVAGSVRRSRRSV